MWLHSKQQAQENISVIHYADWDQKQDKELDKPDLRMLLFYISAVDKSHACVPDRAYV